MKLQSIRNSVAILKLPFQLITQASYFSYPIRMSFGILSFYIGDIRVIGKARCVKIFNTRDLIYLSFTIILITRQLISDSRRRVNAKNAEEIPH
jgi:hypothetical protein